LQNDGSTYADPRIDDSVVVAAAVAGYDIDFDCRVSAFAFAPGVDSFDETERKRYP